MNSQPSAEKLCADSSDFRAPVDGILAMTAMLKLTGLNDEQSRYVRTIEESGRTLLALVERSAAAPRELIPFSMCDLVKEVAAAISTEAGDKGLGFRSYLDETIPASLCGDPALLRSALFHLLRNAVISTGTGEVRLDVRVEACGEKDITLRFTVIDTGDGPREAWELAACRQSIQRMAGDLRVHSVPGEGVTSWFTVQFATGTAPQPAPAPQRDGLRILVAEDHPINQAVLAEQLTGMGHYCHTVTNGEEALAATRESAWDAVLLDCNMPVMDGYQTIRAIRADEAGTSRRLWVVAVTASAFAGDRDACLAAGMDDFLPKPLRAQQLAQVLARIPSPADDAGGATPAIDPATLHSLGKSKSVNGENLLERMTKLFTESGPQLLDQMDHALQNKDFIEAIRAAHKMAGGCSYFGAAALYGLCTDFERLGRNSDHAAIRDLAPRIRDEYGRVEQALRAYIHPNTTSAS